MSYTKGPWVKDKYGSLIGADGYQIVCKSSGLSERCSTGTEEERANANLIAAAPELLESNEWLIDAIKNILEGKNIRDLDERLLFAERATAKAKGEI